MTRRRYDFSESDKVKALLWCARHCCLCGKQVGVGIEVAHLDPHSSELDNAIPLCFDCHAAVGHYNREHPRGRKYSQPELKARRDQVYEEHTRHLIPPVSFGLSQEGRVLPNIGFYIANAGNTHPVRARVRITLAQGDRRLTLPTTGHYDGTHMWNLNPGFQINGHFFVEGHDSALPQPLRARIDVTLIDVYERPHVLLTVGFVLETGTGSNWYLEPSEESLGIPMGV